MAELHLNLKSINLTIYKHFISTIFFYIGHVIFDDAFEPHDENDTVGFTVNSFVKQLVQAVATAGR